LWQGLVTNSGLGQDYKTNDYTTKKGGLSMMEVGCAGILVSDTFCGPMAELPRPGQLLAVEALPIKAGGCAANVAIDLAKQGISVDVAGCLGSDPSAQVLLSSLRDHGVGVDRIVYSADLPTSKTVILLVEGQDRRYIHSFGANAAFTVEHIDRNWVRGLRVFYLGGLFLMPAFRFEELLDLLAFCREHGVITVVDVVISQNSLLPSDLGPLLRLVDYFLPNNDEALLLTGLAHPPDQLRAFMQMGANAVFVTLGPLGVLAGRGREGWQAGSFPVSLVDPSGSGDAFAAGVVLGALGGWDLPSTIRYASALGASSIRALGTTDGVFTAIEAQGFIGSHPLDIQSFEI
jgi:sugar/nucleoside kinase (ribokinase family)